MILPVLLLTAWMVYVEVEMPNRTNECLTLVIKTWYNYLVIESEDYIYENKFYCIEI